MANTNYPTDATSTELLRKAITGEKPTDSRNEAAYAEAVAYASGMSDVDKANFIVGLSPKQQAINDKLSKTSGSSSVESLTDYSSFNRKATEKDYYESLEGGIKAKYGTERAGLQTTLGEAKSAAEISTRAEERAAEERQTGLYEDEYNALERQKVLGSARGLLPTRQQQGAELGITNAAAKLRLENLKERDARIADIQTRINTLKTQTGILTTQSEVNELAELASAKAQAKQFGSQEEHNWRQMAFQEKLSEKAFDEQKELLTMQQGFTADQNELDRDLTREGWDIDLINTLIKMEQQHKYNISSIWTQASASDWASAKAHTRNIQSALNEFIPGTAEYEIATRSFDRNVEQTKKLAVEQRTFDFETAKLQAEVSAQIELGKYTPGTTSYLVAEAERKAYVNSYIADRLLDTSYDIAINQGNKVNARFLDSVRSLPTRAKLGFLSIFDSNVKPETYIKKYKEYQDSGKRSAGIPKDVLDTLNSIYSITSTTGASEKEIYQYMENILKSIKTK